MRSWGLLLVVFAIEVIVVTGSPLSTKDDSTSLFARPRVSTDGRSYSWAGAWMQAPPGQTYTSAYSQFQVEKPSFPSGADATKTYFAAVWVGLSNDAGFSSTSEGVIVQAGVKMNGTNGDIAVTAFWEWFPQPPHLNLALPIAWGDVVSVSITMTSPTTADIVITNQSQNQALTIHTPAQGPQGGIPASLTKAEYIVEDSFIFGRPAPFLNIGKVIFEDCRATIGSMQVGFDPFSGAITMMDGSGKPKVSASISGSSTVDVSYLG